MAVKLAFKLAFSPYEIVTRKFSGLLLCQVSLTSIF
jgi:hypothetical protein